MKKQLCLAGTGWNYLYSAGKSALSVNGDTLLEVSGCTVNGNAEEDALAKRERTHCSVDGRSAELELESVIPFGSEPSIRRRVTMVDGMARVVVDISGGEGGKVGSLELDALSLPGTWKRLMLVRALPAAGNALAGLETITLDGTDQMYFEAELPFLLLVAERPDGTKLEIGIGDDVWRWQQPKKLGGHSAFRIEGSAEGLRVVRKMLDYSKEELEAAERRTWRFKWYFAWTIASDAPEAGTPERELAANNPEVVKAAKGGAVCLKAPAIHKFLRGAVRRIASGESLVLKGFSPVSCNDAAHLLRPKREELPHWDFQEYLDLLLWGNRTLAPGGTLRFEFDAGPYTGLPSMQLFTRPLAGDKVAPSEEAFPDPRQEVATKRKFQL